MSGFLPQFMASKRGLDRYLERVILPTPGLVACWPLDDGAGSVLRDIGPDGVHGTGTFGAAITGPVVNREPINMHNFTTGTPASLGLPSQFLLGDRLTFDFWLRVTSGGNVGILGNANGNANSGVFNVWLYTNNVAFFAGNGSGFQQVIAEPYQLNQLFHYTVKRDGQVVTWYKNGELLRSQSGITNLQNTITGPYCLGGLTPTGFRLTGHLGLVSLYGSPLDGEYIKFLHQAAVLGVC